MNVVKEMKTQHIAPRLIAVCQRNIRSLICSYPQNVMLRKEKKVHIGIWKRKAKRKPTSWLTGKHRAKNDTVHKIWIKMLKILTHRKVCLCQLRNPLKSSPYKRRTTTFARLTAASAQHNEPSTNLAGTHKCVPFIHIKTSFEEPKRS